MKARDVKAGFRAGDDRLWWVALSDAEIDRDTWEAMISVEHRPDRGRGIRAFDPDQEIPEYRG